MLCSPSSYFSSPWLGHLFQQRNRSSLRTFFFVGQVPLSISGGLIQQRFCLFFIESVGCLLLLLYQQLLNRAIHCTLLFFPWLRRQKVSVCCSIKSVFNQATSLSLSFFGLFPNLPALSFLLLVDANAKQMPNTLKDSKKVSAFPSMRSTDVPWMHSEMGMHKNNAHTLLLFPSQNRIFFLSFSPSDVNRLSG